MIASNYINIKHWKLYNINIIRIMSPVSFVKIVIKLYTTLHTIDGVNGLYISLIPHVMHVYSILYFSNPYGVPCE